MECPRACSGGLWLDDAFVPEFYRKGGMCKPIGGGEMSVGGAFSDGSGSTVDGLYVYGKALSHLGRRVGGACDLPSHPLTLPLSPGVLCWRHGIAAGDEGNEGGEGPAAGQSPWPGRACGVAVPCGRTHCLGSGTPQDGPRFAAVPCAWPAQDRPASPGSPLWGASRGPLPRAGPRDRSRRCGLAQGSRPWRVV